VPVFAAATASDASTAAINETAVTDCQAAVDSLCLDDDDGKSSVKILSG